MRGQDPEIAQLLKELAASEVELEQRRIRRELRNRGYFVSRQGRGELPLVREKVSSQYKEGTRKTVVTTVRLSIDVHRRLQFLALDEGRPANAIVEGLIRKYLDEQGVPARLKREK